MIDVFIFRLVAESRLPERPHKLFLPLSSPIAIGSTDRARSQSQR
jgi:hypothetical protein